MPTDATEKNDMAIIGFVGYPNVGKSSVINVFMENKCLQVSATPGKVCSLKLLCLIRIFPKLQEIIGYVQIIIYHFLIYILLALFGV